MTRVLSLLKRRHCTVSLGLSSSATHSSCSISNSGSSSSSSGSSSSGSSSGGLNLLCSCGGVGDSKM
ncbi:hypothetical protein ACSSS7_006053 [Eimeria intestinalis]